mmetsp:Transcript_2990/g.7268  ORF Transcript_2990/g.7268 Transcript_2990/m.7268 type:complete len:333 (-) Transcript_2990:723-1721(-)
MRSVDRCGMRTDPSSRPWETPLLEHLPGIRRRTSTSPLEIRVSKPYTVCSDSSDPSNHLIQTRWDLDPTARTRAGVRGCLTKEAAALSSACCLFPSTSPQQRPSGSSARSCNACRGSGSSGTKTKWARTRASSSSATRAMRTTSTWNTTARGSAPWRKTFAERFTSSRSRSKRTPEASPARVAPRRRCRPARCVWSGWTHILAVWRPQSATTTSTLNAWGSARRRPALSADTSAKCRSRHRPRASSASATGRRARNQPVTAKATRVPATQVVAGTHRTALTCGYVSSAATSGAAGTSKDMRGSTGRSLPTATRWSFRPSACGTTWEMATCTV